MALSTYTFDDVLENKNLVELLPCERYFCVDCLLNLQAARTGPRALQNVDAERPSNSTGEERIGTNERDKASRHHISNHGLELIMPPKKQIM